MLDELEVDIIMSANGISLDLLLDELEVDIIMSANGISLDLYNSIARWKLHDNTYFIHTHNSHFSIHIMQCIHEHCSRTVKTHTCALVYIQ